MRVEAFRITKTKFISTAFNGEGARLYGGRWNSVGTRMVYLADSLSSATLELLVHTEDYSMIKNLYSYIPVNFLNKYVSLPQKASLPVGWDSPMPIAATQLLGDAWISSMSSAILQVPSAITRGEKNFLGNPIHNDFQKLNLGDPKEFKLDPRIK